MNNPLVQKVDQELNQLGFQDATLIRESYHEQHFGNALAVYKLGNLYLNFVRERGDDTVDLLNPSNTDELYIFDDMSLVMGWETLDEMVAEVNARDFSQPPSGPIPLSEALGLIKKHFGQLQLMFSPSEVDATLAKLKDASRKRCKAFFG